MPRPWDEETDEELKRETQELKGQLLSAADKVDAWVAALYAEAQQIKMHWEGDDNDERSTSRPVS